MSKVIAVNAGSSSLKFQLFEMDNETVITSGVIERIGLEDSIFTIKYNGEKFYEEIDMPNHTVAVKILLDRLVTKGIIKSLDEGILLDKTLKYIDYKPRTKKEVIDYLEEHNATVSNIKNIVKKLTEINFIDDDRYTYSYTS